MKSMIKNLAQGLGFGILAACLLIGTAAVADHMLTPAKPISDATPLVLSAPQGTMLCRFNVKGMHCHGCELMVMNSLKDMPGVAAVVANHEHDMALLAVDPAVIDKQALAKAVKDKTGYETQFAGWGDF